MLHLIDAALESFLRATVPLSNMPEFARAFGCRPGDPMVRADDARVRIW